MSKQSACYVRGIGVAVPERKLSAAESVEVLKQACATPRSAKLLRRIVRLTGIETRHLAVLEFQSTADGRTPLYLSADEQPAGPGMGARNKLFEKAAAPLVFRALEAFGPEQLRAVKTLITASCTHASSPGLELPIFNATPVRTTAQRWNLGFMGCSAGLAAMRLVHQTASDAANALIVACELSSLHFQYTDRLDQMTANVLFSDGAAAMVLSSEPSAIRLVDCRCATLPAAADQMIWFADDHGLRLELSQELPDTLSEHLPSVVESFLRDNGLSPTDIDHWLVHPGGPQILDGARESLKLPQGALDLSRSVLRRYGNMSSPTIFFIMHELFETKADGMCLAIAFGPGLTIELALLDIARG